MIERTVYLVVKVKVECNDADLAENAAGEVGNNCDYNVVMDPETGINVYETEVVGCLDACPSELLP